MKQILLLAFVLSTLSACETVVRHGDRRGNNFDSVYIGPDIHHNHHHHWR